MNTEERNILGPLFSVVAWPPRVMHTWIRQLQKEFNVCNFGPPHINLRSPFETELESEDLITCLREKLCERQSFTIHTKGWKRIDHVIFLECEFNDEFQIIHQDMLEIGPSSRAPYDGAAFKPHLTLAIGVLPWAIESLWASVKDIEPPLEKFIISSLSLTREERGEIQELHTFPLSDRVANTGIITVSK